MYPSVIGEFAIKQISFDRDEPGFVRILFCGGARIDSAWTTSFVNEIIERHNLVDITDAFAGIDEEDGKSFILIELVPELKDEDGSKDLVRILISALDGALREHCTNAWGEINEWEFEHLRACLAGDSVSAKKIKDMMATSETDSTGLMASKYGYADG